MVDCLVSLYSRDAEGEDNGEQMLMVLDKVLEIVVAMQSDYERSLEQREKIVEGHNQVMKKLLEKNWEEEEREEGPKSKKEGDNK